MTLRADLTHAVALARKAGAAILAIKDQARSSPTQKADAQGPVTLADLAADAVIREGLASSGDLVITEETWVQERPQGAAPAHTRVWMVDPLDGTEDFIAGRPDYAVHIGLCVDGVPVLGVIFQPEADRLWAGITAGAGRQPLFVREFGAERTHDARIAPVGDESRSARLAVSASHPSAFVDATLRNLGATAVVRGSVGVKIGLIVDGDADAYVTASRRIKVWDTCAPSAVLAAAGGMMTSLAGAPLEYGAGVAHRDGVCAWSAPVATWLGPRLAAALNHARSRERGDG